MTPLVQVARGALPGEAEEAEEKGATLLPWVGVESGM